MATTKLDIKKIISEMGGLKRDDIGKTSVTFSRSRFEAFTKVCDPVSASHVLDYLMECVIRGTKRGKK